jgi:hypothetical protein
MILERHEWKEYHPNGQVWIIGEIARPADLWEHLYDTRTGFLGYENIPMCRVGKWTKYFDNGQIAWTIDFGDGTYDYKPKDKFPSYQKDGTVIQ